MTEFIENALKRIESDIQIWKEKRWELMKIPGITHPGIEHASTKIIYLEGERHAYADLLKHFKFKKGG